MININLLPWRALREKERQREFLFLLAIAVIASIMICLVVHAIFARQLSKQLAVNNYLTQQISIVDQQITEVTGIKQQTNDLLRRLLIIHNLETSRVLLVQMFNNFVNILPNDIYITSIKKDHSLIIVTGKARSNQQVSELMKNIDLSASFSNPVLTEIHDNTTSAHSKKSVLDMVYSQGFELKMKEELPENTSLTPAETGSPATTSSSGASAVKGATS